MSAYRPGDICWDVVTEAGHEPHAVLVIAVGTSTRLGRGRVLETYQGCSFAPGQPPEAVEQFAIVVQADPAVS
jgi:hypothetical protein